MNKNWKVVGSSTCSLTVQFGSDTLIPFPSTLIVRLCHLTNSHLLSYNNQIVPQNYSRGKAHCSLLLCLMMANTS